MICFPLPVICERLQLAQTGYPQFQSVNDRSRRIVAHCASTT